MFCVSSVNPQFLCLICDWSDDVVATGTITLLDEDKILWSLYVDHQLFALSKVDVTVSLSTKVYLSFLQFGKYVKLHKLSTVCLKNNSTSRIAVIKPRTNFRRTSYSREKKQMRGEVNLCFMFVLRLKETSENANWCVFYLNPGAKLRRLVWLCICTPPE